MTEAYKPPRCPPGLGPAGQKLWRTYAAQWELRPDELLTLSRAAKQEDDNARLEQALAAEPILVPGSQNQLIVNGLYAQLRAGRLTAQRLLGVLTVDSDAPAGERKSWAGRKLARARWG